ncbi:MAG: twin-arginine translocase TatA/TatE family subunit [Bacteroidota bacterium]|nr:twin-arginine translocase TatA/TatE family subunit [Bacteroidota bacterium]
MHSLVLGFLNIGSSEMILIVFVALLLFGGEKLPEIARGLGKGIRDFKDASDGVKREINNQINSYEEKREEDKRLEETVKANQDAAQGKLPEYTSGFQPAENTVPLSDNFTPVEHTTAAETHTEAHTEPAAHTTATDSEHTAEHHTTTSTNIDAVTAEHTKHS